MPKLAAPCRMGRSKPAALARWGSAWSGFSSPLSRYKSARLGGVGRSQIFSGAACGTACGAGVSVALPPNPPCLRANVLLSTVATGAPSSPIRSRVFWMMAALPGPLSMTSLTRGRLTRLAFGASGRCRTTLRSPATTRRSSMPKAGSVIRPGQPSTTAMVGNAASPARSYTNLSSPGSSGSMPTPMPSA